MLLLTGCCNVKFKILKLSVTELFQVCLQRNTGGSLLPHLLDAMAKHFGICAPAINFVAFKVLKRSD